jgi:hypothetical protein
LIQREEIAGIVNEIAEELLAISKSYQEIAALAPAIMAKHQEQFKVINDLKSKTSHAIEKIEQQQKKYQTLLEKSQQEVSSNQLNNTLEEQKNKLSIDSYNNILQTLYAQQAIWNKFYEAQEILEQKLKKYSEKISILLYILNINAQLYEQAANVALLHNTTIVSLNNLSHLTELQKIMTEIEGSETEITQWLSKIEQTQL